MRRLALILLSLIALQVPARADTTVSTGYDVVQDEGSNVTRRYKINFIGSGVTAADDATNKRTNITISSGGGSGDVTAVGPGCATGDCFTDGLATSGTDILIWEGSTVDSNELKIISPSADPGADINITLPGATTTLVGRDTTDTLTNKSISGGQITSTVANATSLAANGTNCSAGNYPLGVDASGAVESCTDASTFTSIVTAGANLTIGNGATTAGVLKLLEDTDDGSNFASFTTPALAANTVYTLPADDGDAGEQLQTNGSGVLTWEAAGSGSGAPTDADYLVGTANGSLSAEIVVGTSPGGELGGTWASPTLDDSVTVTGWELGASTATTASADDNDTSLATTAYVQTELNAAGGRSVTCASGSCDSDAENYTDTKCYRMQFPTAADDDKSIWINNTANQFTVTKLWCESDQTTTLMLQVDDGSPADMDSADLSCTSTPATDTALNGDATIAAGDRVDVDLVSVASSPTWATVCFTGTWDD